MLLSIIIPSHNDIYLHKTINSILSNFVGNIEVIPVLDGYLNQISFVDDSRIRPIYHKVNMGMREAINTGVNNSLGDYIMRSDEHCMFGPGFDKLILEEIEDNWIVTPRRYKLDPVEWRRMDEHGFIDYEKLIILHKPLKNRIKFSAMPWKQRTKERSHLLLDEAMAFQGSCWIMSRKWWNSVINRLDSNGYGTLYQDTTEMLFKTWRAGGKLVLNKKTWYAHKHRDFNRTHNYPGELADSSFRYALNLWRDDYEKVRMKWGI